MNPHHIPFKIDTTEYKLDPNDNPVTGQYLRSLGNVRDEYDLWLRARGQEDDKLVKAGDQITVEPGTHFYTAKRDISPGSESYVTAS